MSQTTPSEWIAEQVAVDAPRLCAEIEAMNVEPAVMIRALVERLLTQAYQQGLDKALAGVLPDIPAGGSQH